MLHFYVRKNGAAYISRLLLVILITQPFEFICISFHDNTTMAHCIHKYDVQAICKGLE